MWRRRRKKQPNKSWFALLLLSMICFARPDICERKMKKAVPVPERRCWWTKSNVSSSVRTLAGRGLYWLKLRDFLAGPDTGTRSDRDGGLCRIASRHFNLAGGTGEEKQFVDWLRSNGFMVVTKKGAPAEEGHYKANVDVMMAIDASSFPLRCGPML